MNKYTQLTAADRGAIQVLLQEQYSVTEIGEKLGRSTGTICREISKWSTPSGYRASTAQAHYQRQRRKCRQERKLSNSKRQKYVVTKLQLGWSPEQISGRLRLVEKDHLYVCPETIYQWLYQDGWAYGEEKLYQYLRYGRKKRRRIKLGRSKHRSKIPNQVSIHQRPKVVDKRKELGHWEGDSVIYPNKKAINTLNELKSGLVVFTKLERKTAIVTAKVISQRFTQFRAKTLTLDNGVEFTNHQDITLKTGVSIFFADSYASWQRGSNENCNGLLRGYLPKRTNIDNTTQNELDDIAWELNDRPRKRLGYKTPNEIYYQLRRKSQTVALDVRM